MNTFLRITLLGLFAAAGVGLAVGVASSTLSPADRQSQPAAERSDDAPRPNSAPQDCAPPDAAPRYPTPPDSAAALATSGPNLPRPATGVPTQPMAQQSPPLSPDGPWLRAYYPPYAQPPGGTFPGPGLRPPTITPELPADSVSRDESGLFSIDASDQELRKMLLKLGQVGGKNILVNDKVTGNVSVTATDVDVQAALDAMLKSTGYVAHHEGNFILIGQQEDFADPAGTLRTWIYRPQYVAAADLMELIERFKTPDIGELNIWTPPQQPVAPEPSLGPPPLDEPPAEGADFVVLRDYESVVAEVEKTVALIDVAPPGATAAAQADAATANRPILSPPIQGDGNELSLELPASDIRDVLDLLSEEGKLNILYSNKVQGTVSGNIGPGDPYTLLEAVLKSTGFVARHDDNCIYIGTPEDFDSMELAQDRVGTRVYRPNYVTAAELESLITKLLSQDVGVISVSTPSAIGIETNDSTAEGDALAGSDVVIVRDYEAVLAQIDQLVDEIDVRPAQVAIEAMILSVKLQDTDKFGVNFELLRDRGNVKFGWGTPLSSLASVDFSKGGMKFGFLDSSMGAFLDALESIGDTNVIASPRLLVLNKHRAEIQIGEKKGYVSTTVTETSATQSVEFLDIGALLRLRPFISSDGLIRMEVHPELSDGSVDTESGFTLPNKEVTEVTTNIMVADGCTVIIGGLMREQLTDTTTQVPLVGNLPFFGPVFRNKEEKVERREVLVLITPRIVYEPGTSAEGDKAACEFHRRQSTFKDKMSPLGKRAIGRRYFRLAQDAWANGDRGRALRFAELSVQFDPLSRAAIDLRSNIWQNRQGGDHALGNPAMANSAKGDPARGGGVRQLPPPQGIDGRGIDGRGIDGRGIDGRAIAPWLLEALEGEAAPASLHPTDRGQPGTRTDLTAPRSFQ